MITEPPKQRGIFELKWFNAVSFIVSLFVASVWGLNGIVKISGLERHVQIVATILGKRFGLIDVADASLVTAAIGVGEIAIAVVILSGFRPRLIAVFQIFLVATMNVLEFWLVPDVLLFGRLNALFAGIFIVIVYYDAFSLKSRTSK